MIDKLLRRFCAQEVRIMIAKMEEDYREFTKYQSAWGRLAESTRYLTRVEKYCVEKTKRRATRGYERQQYLAAILKQQLNPMTREELEDSGPVSTAAYRQMVNQQAMNQAYNAGLGFQSARNIYNQGNQP